MSTLDTAIKLAVTAHAGQVDKAGEPYILHPLRVMLAMETEEERIVAVLHDVLEDGPPSAAFAIANVGFSSNVVAALDAITCEPGEPYRDYIERCASDPIAKKVKLADLADNTNPERLNKLPREMGSRLLSKYTGAFIRLSQKPENSPPEKVEG